MALVVDRGGPSPPRGDGVVVALRAQVVMIHDRQRERLDESASRAGFYWVGVSKHPVVGEWTGQQWWVAGIPEPVADGQYEIVGAVRLVHVDRAEAREHP